jgi:hypothetical protein
MGMKKYSHHINRNTKQHKKLWVLKRFLIKIEKNQREGKKLKKKDRWVFLHPKGLCCSA